MQLRGRSPREFGPSSPPLFVLLLENVHLRQTDHNWKPVENLADARKFGEKEDIFIFRRLDLKISCYLVPCTSPNDPAASLLRGAKCNGLLDLLTSWVHQKLSSDSPSFFFAVDSFFGTKDATGKSSGGKLGSTVIFHQLPLTLKFIVQKKQAKNITTGVQIDIQLENLKFLFDDSKFLMIALFVDAIEQLISREKGEVALKLEHQNAGLDKVKFQQLVPKVVTKKKKPKYEIPKPKIYVRLGVKSIVMELRDILQRGLLFFFSSTKMESDKIFLSCLGRDRSRDSPAAIQ